MPSHSGCAETEQPSDAQGRLSHLQSIFLLQQRGVQALIHCQHCAVPYPGRPVEHPGLLTSKSLLNINHLPRTSLHEPAFPLPRPLEPLLRLDNPLPLQIALVSHYAL
jgi:hypothetical protein